MNEAKEKRDIMKLSEEERREYRGKKEGKKEGIEVGKEVGAKKISCVPLST